MNLSRETRGSVPKRGLERARFRPSPIVPSHHELFGKPGGSIPLRLPVLSCPGKFVSKPLANMLTRVGREYG
jgi:hypothetical protein